MVSPDALRVLVVDDEPGQRALIHAMLNACGVEWTELARNGDEAVAMLARPDARFDLVLTDLQMAPGDGFDVIHASAAHGRVRQVVVMSAVESAVLGTLSRMVTHGVSMPVVVEPKPLAMDRLQLLLGAVEASAKPAAPQAPIFSLDDVRRGIAKREFVVYLEPQVDLRSGAVQGFEALARWHHPLHGVIGPGRFIPSIENRPEMRDLTWLLLDDLLRAQRQLARAGSDGSLSLNVADECVLDEHFAEELASRVARAGVRAEHLMLEITETGESGDPVRLTTGLARLRMRGFALALDDFGMGQSTLARMQYGAFSEVKIDREFTANLLYDRSARSAVASIIALARNQGWRCIAEGVESQDVVEQLIEMGCHEAQGYFFSGALDVGRAMRWWDARRDASTRPVSASAEPEAAAAAGETPQWILDLERGQISWGNAAALRLWQVDSADALAQLDLRQALPEAQTRATHFRELLRGGRSVIERWTLRPSAGPPLTRSCVLSSVPSGWGRAAVHVEVPLQAPPDATELLPAAVAEHVPMPLLVIDAQGRVLWRNAAAEQVFGDGARLAADVMACAEFPRDAAPGECEFEASLHGIDGDARRWQVRVQACAETQVGTGLWCLMLQSRA